MIIYFIRHSETIWNKKGILQGHKDSPLTLKGKGCAEKIGKRLKKENIKRIYSSDLGRCVQTAEIINQYLKVDLFKTSSLRERNFGDFNGYPANFVKTELDFFNVDEKAPNGESWNKTKERVTKFISLLSKKKLDKILLVIHEGSLRAILAEYYQVNFWSSKCDSLDEMIYSFEMKNNTIKRGVLSTIVV